MPDKEKYKSFDDIKCIWMGCGFIDYKICDANFECEHCDFDKQMLSGIKLKGNVEEETENTFDIGLRGIPFTHPYYHFKFGQVTKNFLADNYYLGLEPFITKFIDRHSILKYSSQDYIINKGEPVLQISNGWGEVTVLSPFSFRFIEKLDLKNIFSGDRHWFAIIEAERSEIMSNSINKKGYYDKLFETRAYLIDAIKKTDNTGPTMYDGGTILDNWSVILGKNVYRILIEQLFSR